MANKPKQQEPTSEPDRAEHDPFAPGSGESDAAQDDEGETSGD